MDHATATAAIVARYTSLSAAAAWLDSAPTLRERLVRCRYACALVADARGRFGIDAVPGDVAAFYRGELAAVEVAVLPLREALASAYARFQAWDTAWAQCARDGFGPGDSALIGVR